MHDREIVAAIVAGEPGGLATAYDRYALALYAYCRSLLREPADAADAVQDTFIIAAGKLGGLRDPGRLRPWLYAVARNECLRRLRARVSAAPLEEAGELAGWEPDLSAETEREELRALVMDALAALNPRDREIIELNLRHEMEGDDLAGALGVPRNQAHALVSRARAQFGTSLGALLVARTGQESCWELAAICDGWDGRLTPLLRKRVNRHAARCKVCGERRRRELSPAVLLSMLPVVLLPPGLRDQVLGLAADESPAAAAYRARVVRRAGQFARTGFPRPVGPPQPVHGLKEYALAGMGMVAFLAVLGAGTVFALDALHHHVRPPVSALAVSRPPAPAADSPAASATLAAAKPSPAASTPTPAPAAQASPTASASPSASPSGSVSPSPSASASPSPSPSASPTPTGTAVPAPTTVVLAQPATGGPYTGTFTVTAQGGPVEFTITNPVPQNLAITPSSGSLAAGQGVTVTVTVVSATGLAAQTALRVDPGGTTVTVVYPPAG